MPHRLRKPRLRIDHAYFDGDISGRAAPHAKIEAVNLSRIPAHRLCQHDTLIVAGVGDDGRFAGRVGGSGDLIRLRARHAGGSASRWLTIRLPSKGRPRRPAVAVFRIGFRRLNRDEFGLLNINNVRPISEPGAILLFRNLRTAALRRVVLNRRGTFDGQSRLAASPGDRIAVSIIWHARCCRLGTIRVPDPDDGAASQKRLSRLVTGYAHALFDQRRFAGPAVIGRPRMQDVIQGELTDCNLAAAASAVAHARSEAISDMIQREGRDRYQVTLFSRQGRARAFKPVVVTISTSFHVRASGAMLFGSGVRPAAAATVRRTPLWWPILEKAYAELHGGYRYFRDGGTAHHALATLLGQPPHHREIAVACADVLWNETIGHLAAFRPVVVSTAGVEAAILYRNARIMPDHCYVVLGCTTTASGRRLVTLRNPWGEVTAAGARKAPHGSFTMPWEMLVRFYTVLSTVGEHG